MSFMLALTCRASTPENNTTRSPTIIAHASCRIHHHRLLRGGTSGVWNSTLGTVPIGTARAAM